MATLTLRLVKGSPLTNQEVDDNFSNLNTELTSVGANVGILANLTTSAKSNIVAAINELQSESTSNVTITGGSITGITDLAVADGGTGASDAANARLNLGVEDPIPFAIALG